jgi:parallel beta-helix repeat protein
MKMIQKSSARPCITKPTHTQTTMNTSSHLLALPLTTTNSTGRSLTTHFSTPSSPAPGAFSCLHAKSKFRAARLTSVAACMAMASVNALAADILVVRPTDPAAYADIQTAVDAASQGDIIVVHSGTYGPVLITTDDLTIKAAPGADPLIDADGGYYGILIQASGVTVSRLEATNAYEEDMSETPPWFDASAFMIMGQNNTIEDCLATDSVFGFSINPADLAGEIRSTGNVLRGNVATMSFGGFYSQRGDSNTWLDNSAVGNFVGFILLNSNDNSYVNNEAKDNLSNGFWVTAYLIDFLGCENNQFVGNKSNNNGGSGFRVAISTNNRFEGSEASGNELHGFSFVGWSTGNEVIGARIRNNGGYGVHRWPDSEDNLFRGLSLRNNAEGDSDFPLR